MLKRLHKDTPLERKLMIKKNPCIETVYIMRYNEGLKQLAQNTIKDKSYRFSATSN